MIPISTYESWVLAWKLPSFGAWMSFSSNKFGGFPWEWYKFTYILPLNVGEYTIYLAKRNWTKGSDDPLLFTTIWGGVYITSVFGRELIWTTSSGEDFTHMGGCVFSQRRSGECEDLFFVNKQPLKKYMYFCKKNTSIPHRLWKFTWGLVGYIPTSIK